ncbi:protein kinase domain-containing protein [Mycobacterium servetii]|uniref:Protein kinase n=1 Tax=Mycobacterium servetii TaxID=3237418 RepID=A0ABV4C956_9MYCO
MSQQPPPGDTTEWRSGSRFGPYLLKRLLGSGGFGEVYEAFDTVKNRTVALKLLPPSYSANPTFRQRLFREASTAGRLNEPHVVPIHDYGEIDNQLFIDMRLIPGTDLRAVLNQSGPLELTRAISIATQIASALDAAHAEEIVHRDVKPANILLTTEDFACLVDFGLANAATDAKLTSAGTTIGTFAYMAPERFNGQKIDRRTDVYALTCVLYECLTGAPPYDADDQAALVAAHLATPIPLPSQHAGVPVELDDVISRGMAKDPADRYASAGELAAAARRALTAPHQSNLTAAPASSAPPVEIPAPPPSRRRRIAALAAAGTIAAGLIGATPFWMSSHSQPATPAASTAFAHVSATIPVGKHPEGVAVDPAIHCAYTADYSANTVSVIDTRTHTVTATIPVGRGPIGVAVDTATHTLYTANNRDDSVSVVDPMSRSVIATIAAGTNPWGIAIDTVAHTAFTANNWDNTVSVINIDNRSVMATVQVGKHPEMVAVDPTTHTAYVTNNSDGTLSVIDTAHDAVTTSAISVGNGPLGIAVDSTAHAAYTANYTDNTVAVVDITARAVTATIRAGANPWGIAVDPTTHTAYVTNSSDGTVATIDTATHTLTSSINVGNRLWGIAIDPSTHTAYTANSNNTMSVIEPTR